MPNLPANPYLGFTKAIDRLRQEYRSHHSLIVAIDFDDTVYDYHCQGYQYDCIFALLHRCQELKFHLVLFTGSHPDKYPMQIEYMKEHGIFITHVNENPIPLPFGKHGKIYYNILLDDRAGLGQAYNILYQVVTEIEKENA